MNKTMTEEDRFLDDFSINKHSSSHLSETQIEYNIILVLDTITAAGADEAAAEQQNVNKLYEDMINYVEELTADYIWNNEHFYLDKPSKHASAKSTYTSTCVVDYGDNLDDEWFIVHLLFKLTKKFANLIVKCTDSDGEFLLIHAANFLPAWASQATHMANRVFIHNGMLHVIPPAQTPGQVTYMPQAGCIADFTDPARTILHFPGITQASAKIQECLAKKLNLFDLKNYSFHRATCLVPTKLAILLKNNPNLISKAINRFCDKDPADLKLCRTLNAFKPTDLINYRVLFTKHLYSKLKYCEFKPDKRHQWPMPGSGGSASATCTSTANIEAESREKSLLGFKLTCAFEVLSKVLLQQDKSLNKSFEAYLKKLKNLGYFRNYLENSKKYNELYDIARESFEINTSQSMSNNTGGGVRGTGLTTKDNDALFMQNYAAQSKSNLLNQYAQLVDSIYLDKLLDRDYVVKIKEEISSNLEKEKDDSEEWLCVEAPQLDDYLEMYSKGDVGSTYDFRLITNAIKNFIERPSKNKDLLEGAEYKSLDKCVNEDDVLVDFNVDAIEENVKEFLTSKKNATIPEAQDENENDDSDEEDDSFYAVGDDLNNEIEDSEDYETNKLSDSLKNYMSSMDEELREQKNLSRFEATAQVISTSTKSKQSDEDLDIDLNLVTNALESYSSQLGFTGPVSNILKSLGI